MGEGKWEVVGGGVRGSVWNKQNYGGEEKRGIGGVRKLGE